MSPRACLVLALLLSVLPVSAEKPGKVYRAPRIVARTEVQYTEEARKARIEGSVWLKVQLDEKGELQDVAVVQGLSHGLTDQAIACVRQWKFEPAIRDGVPAPVTVQIQLTFRLL